MTTIELEKRTYEERLLTLDSLEVDGRPGHFSAMQGRAVPYDQWTTIMFFRERHAIGSFKRSTDNAARELPLLLFHDVRSFPIGKALSWKHETDGLVGTWSIADSPEAQRAASAAYDGELTGLSVGFVSERSHWDHVAPELWDPSLGHDHMDKWTHDVARLVEVSLTPTPSYESAGVYSVRTAIQPRAKRPSEVESWRAKVESLKR